MDKKYIQKLIDIGFNIIPVSSDKRPLQKWSEFQNTKIESIDQFSRQSDYYAMICGFCDVECIDIDLKVITDYEKRKQFRNDLFNLFNSNIDDFRSKVIIKVTRSGGYHVIYRAYNIGCNNKLAKLKEYNEAVIETRGIGGYICLYEKVLYDRDYNNISYITDEERDILISCCKTLNEEYSEKQNVDNNTQKKYNDIDITPWDDFNNKNRLWDLISNEFSIVKKTQNKIIIRRNGANSPHSGYIFIDNDCMYLFSTGTKYPHEKLLSAFIVYAIQNHGGDYSKAASTLYLKDYGSRRIPQIDNKLIIDTNNRLKQEKREFPIEIFPEKIQAYILESANTLNNSVEYMGCALLWSVSLMIGNTFQIEIKNGWSEICSIWIAVVGNTGVGKSPSLNQILFPLFKKNSEKIKLFQKQKKEYDEYESLSKKDKETRIEIQKPCRSQFIVDDVTIEALINLHSQNQYGVGVFKDELAGWFKDMNKYKEGSDKEQWLSSWSGRGISVDRITRQSDYISKPFLPVLGGIQPDILSSFFTEENKNNGFLDRMLFSYPDLNVEKYNDREISYQLIDFYKNWIIDFYDIMKKVTVYNNEGEILHITAKFSNNAKKEWIRIFNEITDLQNSDDTQEFMKSMLSKQKSYIPRFSMIINTMNYEKNQDQCVISKESILGAEKLSKYFINNYQKLILINTDIAETNNILKITKGSIIEKLKAIYKLNNDFNKADAAKKFNISRTMVYKYLKKIQEEEKIK